jgi:beta-lactamase class A
VRAIMASAAGAGRVVAGLVAVAAALYVIFLAFRGPGGHHAFARGDPGTARSATSAPAPGRSAPLPAQATPTRATALASHADPLAGTAVSYASQRAGTILAAVYDVKTGQTWLLGQGRPQPEASVIKLDIIEALLAQRSVGLSTANRSLARQMIQDSDNAAATGLWHAAGGAAGLQAFNEAAGLADTTPSSCVQCADFPWPGWGLTTTVPADQIMLLKELIEPGTLLTSAERSYALSLMENITPSQRWGVSGGVPAHVTVALKNGWLPLNNANTDWQINSVGWISGDGRDYLMAVLSTGNPTEQYGIGTIDQLAAIVWKAMS